MRHASLLSQLFGHSVGYVDNVDKIGKLRCLFLSALFFHFECSNVYWMISFLRYFFLINSRPHLLSRRLFFITFYSFNPNCCLAIRRVCLHVRLECCNTIHISASNNGIHYIYSLCIINIDLTFKLSYSNFFLFQPATIE